MTEQISLRQFHEAGGVEDWRVVFEGACAHVRTGSFAAGVALVAAIGRLADAANDHPDIDLRSAGVTVRLTTDGIGGLGERDQALAAWLETGNSTPPDSTRRPPTQQPIVTNVTAGFR